MRIGHVVPPLRSRVAAALMLLYGQPVARLVRLTISDIVNDGDQVLIRLAAPPLPVPEPLAGMLLELVGNRQNMTTVNPASQWLFPGRRAGQPVHFSTLLKHLRDDLNLPTQATKSATFASSYSRLRRPSSPTHSASPPIT